MKIKLNLGSTIKRLRIDRKIKQGDLARSCGISQTYLSQIEGNSRTPTLTTLQLICECLNVYLFALIIIATEIDEIDKMETHSLFNFMQYYKFEKLKDKTNKLFLHHE